MKTPKFISKFLIVVAWIVFICSILAGAGIGIAASMPGMVIVGIFGGAIMGVFSGAMYYAIGKILEYTMPR